MHIWAGLTKSKAARHIGGAVKTEMKAEGEEQAISSYLKRRRRRRLKKQQAKGGIIGGSGKLIRRKDGLA